MQYDGYRLAALSELALDANYVRKDDSSDKANNIIYIGKNVVSRSLSKLDGESHHVFRVLLDSSKVINGYLELFLQSELGSLMLAKFLERELVLRAESFLSLAIPLPELSMQVRMIDAAERLEALKTSIQQLETELIFSPPSASAVLEQVDGMLEAVGSLTDADRVLSLIRQGESKSVEFKETFSLDVRKDSNEKYIELSSLKTIAAFLNTEGGSLLVGVDDAGSVVGLDRDIRRFHNGSTDKFLLHFKNSMKTRIGEEYYPFINQRLVCVRGLTVLLVECKKSTNGCFVDGKDFYVRTNPSTDKLEGAKLISYMKNNFSL
jgi:Putative DNA-binding domain